jgi:hypothetical protein
VLYRELQVFLYMLVLFKLTDLLKLHHCLVVDQNIFMSCCRAKSDWKNSVYAGGVTGMKLYKCTVLVLPLHYNLSTGTGSMVTRTNNARGLILAGLIARFGPKDGFNGCLGLRGKKEENG